jgi:hypothetical protein
VKWRVGGENMNSSKVGSLFLALSFCQLASSNFAFADRPVRGVYTVPVSDDLAEYASYSVKFKANTYEDIPSELVFFLPEQLVGSKSWITFRELEIGSGKFVGEKGSGSCALNGRDFECQFKFDNLSIDESLLQESIEKTYLDLKEQAARKLVAERFGGEPIGILSYRLRGKFGKSPK